jgi:hypothetical protein
MDKLERQRNQHPRALAARIEKQYSGDTSPPAPPPPPQRWSEWITAAVAVLALALALITYTSQQRINDITETRDQRRYADRVFWWTSDTTAGLALSLQNRSTAPLVGVIIDVRVWGANAERKSWNLVEATVGYATDTVPPCVIATIALPTPARDTSAGIQHIEFRDGKGLRWRKHQDDGPERVSGWIYTDNPQAEAMGLIPSERERHLKIVSYEKVEDCTDT